MGNNSNTAVHSLLILMYVPVRAQVKYKWDGTGRRAGAAGRRDDDNRRLTDFLLDDSPHSNYFSACAAPATLLNCTEYELLVILYVPICSVREQSRDERLGHCRTHADATAAAVSSLGHHLASASPVKRED